MEEPGRPWRTKCSIHKHSGAGVSPGLALTLQPAGSSALLAIETAQEFGLELRVSLASCLLTLLQVSNNIEIYFFPFLRRNGDSHALTEMSVLLKSC